LNLPTAPETPASHPLDNVIWSALTTCQAPLSVGDEVARRFNPAYARFAALAQPSTANLSALARFVNAGEGVAMFVREDLEPGDYFEMLARKNLVQMRVPANGRLIGDPVHAARFVVLGDADRAQMASLVERTEPGPWVARSGELGRFVGLRVDGQLVAMAGERMHLTGYTEISAVCTDPAWRGQGLARDLILVVAQGIVARGEVPFLHVIAENATAIALYERLGFVRRMAVRIGIMRRNDKPSA
jgi:ribosomal protein S18 acetylase RimI-like enzyme